MTEEDIIRMAQEAKLLGEFDTAEYIFENGVEVWISGQRGLDALEKFAAFVASAERERIAKKIEQLPFGDTSASFAIYVREAWVKVVHQDHSM